LEKEEWYLEMPARRCRYLVNTNFVVDLARGDKRAQEFAVRNKGLLCASRLVFYELEARVEDPRERQVLRRELRRTIEDYEIKLLSLTRDRFKALFLRALDALKSLGVDPSSVSINTVHDTIYALLAKEIGADLVTGTWRLVGELLGWEYAVCTRGLRIGHRSATKKG